MKDGATNLCNSPHPPKMEVGFGGRERLSPHTENPFTGDRKNRCVINSTRLKTGPCRNHLLAVWSCASVVPSSPD